MTESGYSEVSSKGLEEVLTFLREKSWYSFEDDNIFIFQLYQEEEVFVEETDIETKESVERVFSTSFGIHPLDWENKEKQILKMISELWL